METAAQVFVRCLENEGVRHVFGIPGEETLDLNEALDRSSSIEFVPVRHEQGGAFMADAYGRLTGRAGVCLGTLGPGATNLVTGMADAFLDRAPVVALTGQTDLSEMHKESHQYIDVVRMMKPVTKWNARVHDPDIIPEAVRKAFAVAEREKPGATHLELPADVMELPLAADPVPRPPPALVEPVAAELHRAAALRAADRAGPRRHLHGQGRDRRRRRARAVHRRPARAGLSARVHGPVRPGRVRRVRPGRVVARELEPEPRPPRDLHRHDAGRERRALRARRRVDRRHLAHPHAPGQPGLGQAAGPGRDTPIQPDDPRRAGVTLRRRVPDQAAARAARPARADGPERPADLRCGRAQAVDLAPV